MNIYLFTFGYFTMSLIVSVRLRYLPTGDEASNCYYKNKFKICTNILVAIDEAFLNRKNEQQVIVIDKNITSIVPSAFENLNLKHMKLELQNDKLKLKPNVFQETIMLESLEINPGIVNLEPNIFAGLKSLRSLSLTIDGTRQNFANSLAELVSLEQLTIINSNLTNVNSQTFYKIHPAIKRLDLSSNNITKIGTDAFSTLLSLSTLIINKNNLVNIQEGVFDGMDHLLHLEITSNKLTTIERKMFRGLARLETLDLSDNLITHIGDKSFNGLNISTLLLSNNKLKTIKRGIFNDIKSLKAINLNNNQIFEIFASSFSGTALDKLNLSKNKISYIDVNIFKNIFVKILDISENDFHFVAEKAFEHSKIMSLIVNKKIDVIKSFWGLEESTQIIAV